MDKLVASDDGSRRDGVRAAVDVCHFASRFLDQQGSGGGVPRVLRGKTMALFVVW